MLDNIPAHANNHKQILDLILFVILFVNDQWSVMNILILNEPVWIARAIFCISG